MEAHGYSYVTNVDGKQIIKGKGSFGIAVLVKNKAGDVLICKKVLLRGLGFKERLKARNEAQLLVQLKHPNIIKLYEFWEEDETICMIMEYADGGTLNDRIKNMKTFGGKNNFDENHILAWMVQMSLALKYLHEKHILHRDLKADNIFLTSDNTVKLGDFGISTVLYNTIQQATTLCGTPYYFSPELCKNAPYNNKSDVWALGCLCYELATLKKPFLGRDVKELMKTILNTEPNPLPSMYSKSLQHLINTMLLKDAQKRPSVTTVLLDPVLQPTLMKLGEILQDLSSSDRVGKVDIHGNSGPPPMLAPIAAPTPVTDGGLSGLPAISRSPPTTQQQHQHVRRSLGSGILNPTPSMTSPRTRTPPQDPIKNRRISIDNHSLNLAEPGGGLGGPGGSLSQASPNAMNFGRNRRSMQDFLKGPPPAEVAMVRKSIEHTTTLPHPPCGEAPHRKERSPRSPPPGSDGSPSSTITTLPIPNSTASTLAIGSTTTTQPQGTGMNSLPAHPGNNHNRDRHRDSNGHTAVTTSAPTHSHLPKLSNQAFASCTALQDSPTHSLSNIQQQSNLISSTAAADSSFRPIMGESTSTEEDDTTLFSASPRSPMCAPPTSNNTAPQQQQPQDTVAGMTHVSTATTLPFTETIATVMTNVTQRDHQQIVDLVGTLISSMDSSKLSSTDEFFADESPLTSMSSSSD